MEQKSLEELYEEKEKLLLFLEFADIYGGSVETDTVKYTSEELLERLEFVKSEIASRLSNKTYLHFLK